VAKLQNVAFLLPNDRPALGRGCNSPPPFGRVTSEPFSAGHDRRFLLAAVKAPKKNI
jgi:hypothetical protein